METHPNAVAPVVYAIAAAALHAAARAAAVGPESVLAGDSAGTAVGSVTVDARSFTAAATGGKAADDASARGVSVSAGSAEVKAALDVRVFPGGGVVASRVASIGLGASVVAVPSEARDGIWLALMCLLALLVALLQQTLP